MNDLDYEQHLARKAKHSYLRSKPYGSRKVKYVQALYLIASLFWILLIYLLKLFQTDFYGYLILLIPLFVFTFGFINATNLSVEVEETLYRSNYLSIGLIIILPLLTWMTNDYKGSPEKKVRFLTIIIVALILVLFSLIDIWMNKKWLTIVKHVKSVLQTLAITLIIYALYLYYVERCNFLY